MKQDGAINPYLLFFEPDTAEHEYSAKLRANAGVKMKRVLLFLAIFFFIHTLFKFFTSVLLLMAERLICRCACA